MRQVKNWRVAFLICCVSLLCVSGVRATPILAVDGNPADWGFTVADNNGSTFVPAAGLNLLGIQVHDHNDLGGVNAPLDVYSGGQKFDAECLAAAYQGGQLYIFISTGQRPDNGFANYAPGDIVINTTGGTYSIEVGGGMGGGSGSAITEGAAGSTYTMNQGFTTAYQAAPATQTAGSIWLNPWFTYFDQMHNQGVTQVGTADYLFTRNTFTTQHAVIEASLPLSLLGSSTIQSISWGPACDNSFLTISAPVPEPSTLLLAVTAVAGFNLYYRRRRPT